LQLPVSGQMVVTDEFATIALAHAVAGYRQAPEVTAGTVAIIPG